MNWLAFGAAYVGAHIVVGWALASHPVAHAWFGNLALLAPPLLFAALVIRRRRDWVGCEWLFWASLALGALLWAVGHLGFTLDDLVFAAPNPWLRGHTVFTLAGASAIAVALLAEPHRGPREGAVATVAVDLAGAAIFVLFLFAYFVLVPALVPVHEAAAQRSLLVAAQLLRFVILAGLGWLAYRARGGPWGATYAWLAGAMAVGFAMRAVASLAIARGDYAPGMAYDLAWIVPYLALVWAAATAPPSAEPVTLADAQIETTLPSWLSFVALATIPMVGYGVRWTAPFGDPVDEFRGLLTAVSVLAVLAVLAVRLAVQRTLLRRADTRLRLLAAATQRTRDLILILGHDGRFVDANEAFCQAVGYSLQELAANEMPDLVEQHGGGTDLRARIRATVTRDGVWRGTLNRRRRDGTTFPSACTVTAIVDAAGRPTHFVGIERDISEELRLREQLIHSERLSAIGELVAGVAHELNNPLQSVVGSTELLIADPRSPDAPGFLEVVRVESRRASQIVRNLLAFVRRSPQGRTRVDLNEIVRTVTSLRGYSLKAQRITLETRIGDRSVPVDVNREEIQQALMNLLLNAEQAIAGAAGRGRIVVTCAAADGEASIEVADDGPGVSREQAGRVFEPFFTTKGVGEGTGLGLSISLGIARAHGGRLALVDSPVGACFRLTLPLADRS